MAVQASKSKLPQAQVATIVLATPPAASISRATNWPRFCRWTWPGTNCVKLLTTAMMGLPKSPCFMPVARHKARAPAMLRPAVDVRER